MLEPLYPPDAKSTDYTAFAHKEDIEEVLEQDVIYVNGTAIVVQYASRLLSRYCVKPGTFMIARRGMGDWFSSFSMYGLPLANSNCSKIRCPFCSRVMAKLPPNTHGNSMQCFPCDGVYTGSTIIAALGAFDKAEREAILKRGWKRLTAPRTRYSKSKVREDYYGTLTLGSDSGTTITHAELYDGLSAPECLERYTTRQQKELFDETTALTPVQLEAARNLWSVRLRAKT